MTEMRWHASLGARIIGGIAFLSVVSVFFWQESRAVLALFFVVLFAFYQMDRLRTKITSFEIRYRRDKLNNEAEELRKSRLLRLLDEHGSSAAKIEENIAEMRLVLAKLRALDPAASVNEEGKLRSQG